MIKNICKNIIMDVARRDAMHRVSTTIIVIVAMCFLPSCSNYLDIVPDKSFTLDNIFSTKDDAYSALAKIYWYLPDNSDRNSYWLLGDEWISPRFEGQNINGNYVGVRIMQGLQSGDSPLLGTWSGTQWGRPLYQGINACNLFISRIDQVKDMTDAEKADWKAQATFLKAYYHFLLLQMYGPIVIMDEVVSPNDDPAGMYVSRSKIDDCFNYIDNTLDKAITDLAVVRDATDEGQVDKLGALSIKARVLLFRASPFYSGNGDYSGFLDHDGKPFFPQDDAATTKAKWNDAVKAIDNAITECEKHDVKLYRYTQNVGEDDREAARLNPDNIQTLYDLRWVICDNRNTEMIWKNTNVTTAGDRTLFTDCNIMTYNIPNEPNNYTNHLRQILGGTYKTLERYYTKNGLPLDDDVTFNRSTMHDLAFTPRTSINTEYLGILQDSVETINLYLNREPRLYAHVGITGSYWRGHSRTIPTVFYANTNGGRQSSRSPARPDNFFWTSIGVQKVVHPDSKRDYRFSIAYPMPIIRLADLYLMKAEALNEYLDAPGTEVYDAINVVRQRAGIPTVQQAYTGPYVNQDARNRHQTQAGMRKIIARERENELAFEGIIFWDKIRTRMAPETFSTPAQGWSYDGAKGADFFQLQILQTRTFTLRDCLWPIDLNELNKNSNLIQNPGW